MKEQNLVSISEAARAAKVSRMTIHRFLKKKQLTWHGSTRRGRNAQGIDMFECWLAVDGWVSASEIQKAFSEEPPPTAPLDIEEYKEKIGFYTPKEQGAAKSKRVLVKMQRWLREQDADCKDVMLRLLIAASVPDADADLLLYSASCLVRRNKEFLQGLLTDKEPVSTSGCAGRLIAEVYAKNLLPGGEAFFRKQTFSTLWGVFILCIRKSSFSVYAVFLHDPGRMFASVLLGPQWVDRESNPKLKRHEPRAAISFSHTRGHNEKIVKNVSRHISCKLFGVDGKSRNEISFNAVPFKKPVDAYMSLVDAIKAPIGRYEEWEKSWLPILQELGLNKIQARAFARTIRRVSRLPDPRKMKQLGQCKQEKNEVLMSNAITCDVEEQGGNNQKEDEPPQNKGVSKLTISKALGVSRLTVRRWEKSAKGIYHQISQPEKHDLTLLECEHCGFEPISETDTKCPECGRLL